MTRVPHWFLSPRNLYDRDAPLCRQIQDGRTRDSKLMGGGGTRHCRVAIAKCLIAAKGTGGGPFQESHGGRNHFRQYRPVLLQQGDDRLFHPFLHCCRLPVRNRQGNRRPTPSCRLVYDNTMKGRNKVSYRLPISEIGNVNAMKYRDFAYSRGLDIFSRSRFCPTPPTLKKGVERPFRETHGIGCPVK